MKTAKQIALFAALFFISYTSHAARSYTPESLPQQVKRAVSINLHLVENRIQNILDSNSAQKSQGSLIAELLVDTRNSFNVYKENFSIQTTDGWLVEVLNEPSEVKFMDPVTKTVKSGYRDQTLFELKFSIDPSQPSAKSQSWGPHSILPVTVGFQACNKELCLLPINLELELGMVRNTLSLQSSQEEASWLEQQSEKLQDRLQENTFGLQTLFVLLIAGILTAFTPCVYPLYPITLGLFSKWTAASLWRTLVLSLSYAIGISTSYAIVGVFAASTGKLFGSFTQTPAFLIGMGLLILFSALFFSGLLPFQAPLFLQNFFGKSESENSTAATPFVKRVGSATFMGAGLGVLAAPCVGPVIIALMAWLSNSLAQSESAMWEGGILLATFGLGMSLPLLVLANIIVGMKRQPKLGKWTPYFKHFGTLMMLAGSMFFLIPGIQLATQIGAKKSFDFPVYTLESRPSKWTVVDFRADWCAACIELENETFSSQLISESFKENREWGFVSVDLTNSTPENQEIAEGYDIIGLPTVLILSPDGKVCKNHSLFGFEGPERFDVRMKRAQKDCN